MATGLDFVTDAYARTGVFAPSEVLTAAASAQGLTTMNDLIDSWSNESLITFAIQEQAAPLQPGVWQYTIGPGGTWNMPRPLRVLTGPGRAYVMDSNGNRYPLEVIQRDQWNLIGNIQNIGSNLPTSLFFDPTGYPLATINVWPIPILPYMLFWDSFLPLVEIPTLATTVTLPPGYNRALKTNLALELAPYYKPDSWQPPALLVKQAAQSLAAVKRTNVRPYRALFDRAILRFPRASYNIFRGS